MDYRSDAPKILRDFLIYHETIKGHSHNTVDEYFLDLRTFFRFLKLHRGLAPRNMELEEIGIGDAEKAYKRALLLEVLNMTLPGVPCIYQGDEYGETGANDPDNRHMMRFTNLNEQEKEMRAKVAELVHMRRNSMPLLYGDFIPLIDRPDKIVYQRVYLGEKVTIVINRDDLTYQIISD